MQNLYLKIVETINQNKQMFIDEELEPPRHIDLYNGQPDNPKAFEFVTPALFVDYGIDWSPGTAGAKQGTLTIDCHILTAARTNSESWSDATASKELLFHEIIMELLESVSTDNVTSLICTGEKPSQTDFFDYHIMTFTAATYRQKRKRTISIPRPPCQIATT